MNKYLALLVTCSFLLGACSPAVSSITTTEGTEPPTLGAVPTSLPTPSPVVAPASSTTWKTYVNDYMGYQFDYPSDATIGEEGFNGMDVDEPIPPGMTFQEYFDYLSRTLPKKICVGVSVGSPRIAGVVISPPYEPIGKFSGPCGALGLGTGYRNEGVSETFNVGGKLYQVNGTKFIREATGIFDFEFFIINLENGFNLYFYGGAGQKTGQTYDEYLPYKETVKQILATLKWTASPPVGAPTLTCAGIFTHLLPGRYAEVSNENTTPNPLRSEPNSGNNAISSLLPRTRIRLIEGPLCRDGLVFWKVEVVDTPGNSGWIAEGDGTRYFLSPVE